MDKIDNEEKAYWLGFFYADAYNHEKRNRVVIELQEQDRLHLNKCAAFFGQPRPPFIQYKNKGKYIAYRLELNSSHLCQSLKKHGCYQSKSFGITFPAHLDSQLVRHFVRGYFDGDGCLHITKSENQLNLQIVSTKEMIESLAIIMSSIGVKTYISHPERYTGNTYRLDTGGSRQVKKFCDWIYKDATIYLDRKYELFKSYCENHQFRFND